MVKNGHNRCGSQQYKCKDCGKSGMPMPKSSPRRPPLCRQRIGSDLPYGALELHPPAKDGSLYLRDPFVFQVWLHAWSRHRLLHLRLQPWLYHLYHL